MPYTLAEDGASILLNWATGWPMPPALDTATYEIRLMVSNGTMFFPGAEVAGNVYAPQPVSFAAAVDNAGVIQASSSNSVSFSALSTTDNTIVYGAELWAVGATPLPLRIAWTEHVPYTIPAGTGVTFGAGSITFAMNNSFTSGQGSDAPIGFDRTFRLKMVDWLLGQEDVEPPELPLMLTLVNKQDVSYDVYDDPHPGDLWTEEVVTFSAAVPDGAAVSVANTTAVQFEGLDSAISGPVGAFEIWDSAGSPQRIGIINTLGHPMGAAPSIPAATAFQIPAGFLKLKIV